MDPRDKFMAPNWTALTLKGELLNKCKIGLTTLEWGGFQRYFEHSSLHWSPWLSKQGVELESSGFIEVARRLNNKGLMNFIDLWERNGENLKMPQQWENLSLMEKVLISRRLDHKVRVIASPPLISKVS